MVYLQLVVLRTLKGRFYCTNLYSVVTVGSVENIEWELLLCGPVRCSYSWRCSEH